jgi:hypothetical protein
MKRIELPHKVCGMIGKSSITLQIFVTIHLFHLMVTVLKL